MTLEEFVKQVVEQILQGFDAVTKKYAGVDEKSVLDMIGGHLNEHKEFVLNYPDHFNISVEEMWENDHSVEVTVKYYRSGIRSLVNGTLSAM